MRYNNITGFFKIGGRGTSAHIKTGILVLYSGIHKIILTLGNDRSNSKLFKEKFCHDILDI